MRSTTKHYDLLEAAVANWWVLIKRWSVSGLLSWAAEQAWSSNSDLSTIRELEEQTAQGDTTWLPSVAVISDIETTEPRKATYQAESQTIAVNNTWLEQTSEKKIIEELTRELARYLSQLSPQSTKESDIDAFASTLTNNKDFKRKIEKSIGFEGLNSIKGAKANSFSNVLIEKNTSTNDDNTTSTIYVSLNGNNTNPGTLRAPFRTIQHAINKA